MEKKSLVQMTTLVLALSLLCVPAASQVSPKDLAPRYRVWLEEEVVYIITPTERKVFLQLDSDRARDQFMQAFWKYRDPNPTTPENEFRDEHYKRIKYANQYLGKEGPGAGWRSAMGRIHIILGEPNYAQTFENLTMVYPMVIWFYPATPERGFHQAFNVAFFKPRGIGEYELYSPVRFGPQHLIPNYQGDPSDYLEAYRQLMQIEPAIAEVSLTLIPGESAFSMSPSIASEVLLNATIPTAPHRLVKDTWAEKLLAYRDIVEVEYSTNYIESDSIAQVVEDASGVYFVHYLIEPSRLTFEQYEGRFLTNLEINGNVTDREGTMIYQFEKSIPFEFNQEQMTSIRNKLFSYQDMFPLVEGEYKLSVLFKNRVSKEFASMEKDISIPDAAQDLRMSPLLLANKVLLDSQYRGKGKPFLIDDVQLVPSPRNDFSSQDTLHLFFQIHGLTPELKEGGTLSYSISSKDQEIQAFRKNVRDYDNALNILEEISLAEFPPAYYKIKASLLDTDGGELLFSDADFYISHLPSLPRPWLLSLPVSSLDDPVYLNIQGNQLLNKRDLAGASRLLEAAYRKNTQSSKFALDYCRSLFAANDYRQVKDIALPFLERPERHEFLEILGDASQKLGELAEAVSYFKSYLEYYGTNIRIFNAVGECYHQMGNTEEALTAWERSLELDPKQEELRKLVESLKKKESEIADVIYRRSR